jgi:predicted transcriptional regulator of viral defense system
MRKTRFQIAKRDIVSSFENSDKRIYTYSDISNILYQNRDYWRLPASLSTLGFIEQLTEYTKLKRYEINFPNNKIIRFSWGRVSAISIASGLKSDSYLTHYTAMFLHNLTEQIPKTVYVNHEQTQKNYRGVELIQSRIDNAFSRPQRASRNSATLSDYNILLLNGKHTNRMGVIEMIASEGEKVMVTNIERTLIDIVVRPSYSGGIYEVLKAYRRAVGEVSINKLTAMLKSINYIYPYHQAIGFYLQKSEVYKESQIQLLKKFDQKYDFYITHQITELEYSKEWKLYYPKGF